ncbi:hypothetical protein [Chondrinema litorale]|uniref:hypothetical protein n=1 Tax=Chondrinema litorale TaxID=2994555 RepID=UPI002543D4BD|nr:hypothetical protein [Chondrinema litorale]UZS00010.1 hypothetical protein OQ292_39195 [Chondrinema litorale]
MVSIKKRNLCKALIFIIMLCSCKADSNKKFFANCQENHMYTGEGKGIIRVWNNIMQEEMEIRKTSLNKKYSFLRERKMNSINDISIDSLNEQFNDINKSGIPPNTPKVVEKST